MLHDINNTVNSIRRRQEKDEVFTISAMNSVKTQKLMAVYDITTAVEDITFDEISVIDPTPGEFCGVVFLFM
ncbi:1216_t:CDS:1, partial [Entrophospora sp. SA101]